MPKQRVISIGQIHSGIHFCKPEVNPVISIIMTMLDVPIKRIVPIYKETRSTLALNQMIAQIKRHRLPQDCMMVEQVEHSSFYYLITGYSIYLAYQLCGKERATCFCRPTTDEVTRRMDALLWLYAHSQVWLEKNEAINDLLGRGLSQQDLAEYMGVKRSVIEKYLIHPAVPLGVSERAKANDSSFTVINKVAGLPLPDSMKNQLYERALLSGRQNDKKLTTDKVKWLKRLLKVDHFMALQAQDQWDTIERTVFNFEKLITNKMKKEVDQRWLANQVVEIK